MMSTAVTLSNGLSPSPGTPGEGWGGGSAQSRIKHKTPTLTLPRSTGRGKVKRPSSFLSNCSAFTLVEATISLLIVAVMLSAALATVGTASRNSNQQQEMLRGLTLGRRLMSEIVSKYYQQPNAMTLILGPRSEWCFPPLSRAATLVMSRSPLSFSGLWQELQLPTRIGRTSR